MNAKGPEYGWFGDDFTGASDTLATIAARGKQAFLFLDVPDEAQLAAVGALDAIGIAGSTRAESNAGIRATLEPVSRFFRAQNIRLVHYKCCSTFDSALDAGNLITAVKALRQFIDVGATLVIGGQPSLGRYCAFGNLFARFGAQIYRLDRHPTMSRHPVTPMVEADLARHLEGLGGERASTIPWTELEGLGADDLMTRLQNNGSLVLLDALTPEDIERIGVVLRDTTVERSALVLGASSVAEAYFGSAGPEAPRQEANQEPGPVLGLAGSLSPNTRIQVAAARSYEKLFLTPSDLTDALTRDQLIADSVAHLGAGRNLLLVTAPADGTAPQHAASHFAAHCGALVNDILTRQPVRKLALAGGDTSSLVSLSAGIWGLGYHSHADRGVCVCTTRASQPERDGLQVMLKGGQMGGDDLFDNFAAGKAFQPQPRPI